MNQELSTAVAQVSLDPQLSPLALQPKYVAILCSDAKREYFPTEEQYISEADSFKDATLIAGYIEKMGIKTSVLLGNDELTKRLQEEKPDLVFNLVDSVRGQEHLAPTIPALIELLNIPFTGTGMLGLAINMNKYFTKKLLELVGLPVPRYQLFNTPNDPLDGQLKFPLISKLNEVHGSVGIDHTSVADDEKSLRQRIKELMNLYKQPVLVEEFIVGREITCVLLEGTNRKVYQAEKILPEVEGSKYKLASFSFQWLDKNPAPYVKHEGGELLKNYIRSAFDVLKMESYAKFDLRLDESGRYYFIDCNANPAFGPKELGTAIGSLSDMYGIQFDEVIKRIMDRALKDKSFHISPAGETV